MSVDRHDIYQEDVGAYLLCALSEAEEQRFERHVEECPVCQDELQRLRPAVDALPRSVSPLSAPPGLKTALMAAVRADVRDRRPLAARSRRSRSRGALRARLAGASAALTNMRPAVAWVAASIVLLLGIVSGAAGLYALTDVTKDEQGSRTLAARVDKTRVPFASASLGLPDDRKGAVLRVHGFPTLEQSSVYQVWVQREGEVISQSLFSVGESGDGAAAVADDLEGAQAVLVTREPAGGAKAPSEEPIVRVGL